MTFPLGGIQGIDVSHYQAVVEWPAVAGAGKVFAYAKATEGTDNTDPYFHDNWSGMGQAGLLRGAYHFFHAGQDAAEQADNFIAALTSANGSPLLNPGDLPATLDLEITSSLQASLILAAASTWLALVGAATGRMPILYTYYSFWNSTLNNPRALADHPLWIARYTTGSTPGTIGAWPSWTFWQHAPKGTVEGIGGDVDLNAFYGTIEQLNALAGL